MTRHPLPPTDRPLGILMLDGEMATAPGCMASDVTFPYPVLRQVVPGARAPASRVEAEALLPAYVAAARNLEDRGAAAITDNCNGLFAHLQGSLSAAVGVPVITSALMLVPELQRMVPGRRIGLLTFFEDAVDEPLFQACGWSSGEIPIAVAGVAESAAWRTFLATKKAPEATLAALEDGLCAAARRLLDRHPDVGAFVAECTLLPPATQAVRVRLGLPVFDVLTLLDLTMAGRRRPAAARGAWS